MSQPVSTIPQQKPEKELLRRDRMTAVIASILLHLVFLTGGGFLMAQSAQYGVEAGGGGIEINLVAAPVQVATEIAVNQPKPEEEKEAPPEETAPEPEPEIPQPQNILQTTENLPQKGDGSSPIAGYDSTTFYSSGGAISDSKSSYLTNPAPPYPWEARRNGWEGFVLLRVVVSKTGRAEQVELEKGSGHAVLDRAALKTIKTWRFLPAHFGGMAVESRVRVPIRFRIEESLNEKAVVP